MRRSASASSNVWIVSVAEQAGSSVTWLKISKAGLIATLSSNIYLAATCDFQQCGMCDKQSLRSASLIRAFACRLSIL